MNIYEYAEDRGESVSDLRRDNTRVIADACCEECGHEWDCGMIPATRYQPAEARWPDCPNCGR